METSGHREMDKSSFFIDDNDNNNNNNNNNNNKITLFIISIYTTIVNSSFSIQ